MKFRRPWKRSLIELNGRTDPNYRHYLSTLIIDSYSKVSACVNLLLLLYFKLNFTMVLQLHMLKFTPFFLCFGEQFMGQLQKREEHFLINIISMGSLARPMYEFRWTHLVICLSYFDMILKNEYTFTMNFPTIWGGNALFFYRLVGLSTVDWVITRVQSQGRRAKIKFPFSVTSENFVLVNLHLCLFIFNILLSHFSNMSLSLSGKVSLRLNLTRR